MGLYHDLQPSAQCWSLSSCMDRHTQGILIDFLLKSPTRSFVRGSQTSFNLGGCLSCVNLCVYVHLFIFILYVYFYILCFHSFIHIFYFNSENWIWCCHFVSVASCSTATKIFPLDHKNTLDRTPPTENKANYYSFYYYYYHFFIPLRFNNYKMFPELRKSYF